MPGFHPGFIAASNPLTLAFIIATTAAGGSGTSAVTGSASILAGDILIYEDYARTVGSIPTAVTPSGFTNVINATLASTTRLMISYKIATGAEASAAITGMNGGQSNEKILQVFRPSRALVSLVSGDPASEITDGDPVGQTCNVVGVATPLIVFASYGSTGGLNTALNIFTPTEDGVSNSSTFNYLKYKIYNTAPADTSVDMPDRLNANALSSFYLRAT